MARGLFLAEIRRFRAMYIWRECEGVEFTYPASHEA